jgi:hypothetical protein
MEHTQLTFAFNFNTKCSGQCSTLTRCPLLVSKNEDAQDAPSTYYSQSGIIDLHTARFQ